MRLIFLLLILLCGKNFALAQIGKSYEAVESRYGKNYDPSRKFLDEGPFLMANKIVSENERRMIMFNEDTVVVGVVISYMDSSMTKQDLKNIISEEVPVFEKDQYATAGRNNIYWYDSNHNILLLLHPASSENIFPLTGAGIVTDKRIIKSWTRRVDQWEKK